jgi:hypothetical protein
VNHDLLEKAFYYSIRGRASHWFTAYLTKWEQKVEILHNKWGQFPSHWGKIKCGVHQGSIFGPLVFFLYTYYRSYTCDEYRFQTTGICRWQKCITHW